MTITNTQGLQFKIPWRVKKAGLRAQLYQFNLTREPMVCFSKKENEPDDSYNKHFHEYFRINKQIFLHTVVKLGQIFKSTHLGGAC